MGSLSDLVFGKKPERKDIYAQDEKLRKEEEAERLRLQQEAVDKKKQDVLNKKAKATCEKTEANPAGLCFAKGGSVRGNGKAQRGLTRGKLC
jgi:hypothetical protein